VLDLAGTEVPGSPYTTGIVTAVVVAGTGLSVRARAGAPGRTDRA
jgi:hypothetical protein